MIATIDNVVRMSLNSNFHVHIGYPLLSRPLPFICSFVLFPSSTHPFSIWVYTFDKLNNDTYWIHYIDDVAHCWLHKGCIGYFGTVVCRGLSWYI